MENKDLHLDIFLEHSELHYGGKVSVFQEGVQTEEAQNRYAKIIEALKSGYLEDVYRICLEIGTSRLDETFKELLRELVEGVTSEVGRALVGLTFLQITIKSIVPEQSIRLHKGSPRNGSFSWKEGISMRTLDANYTSIFLREKGLLNVNKFGVMMTRSLAENYPYSRLYKAEMRGAFDIWIKIVDALEAESLDYHAALAYMMSLLINRSKRFKQTVDDTLSALHSFRKYDLQSIVGMLTSFFTDTRYSARAFEVVIHAFMQAYSMLLYTDLELVPLSQMRSANKKHGNVGDIELKDGKQIVEAWDAKYGKSYLYDELGELQDKLESVHNVSLAGFIVNDQLNLKDEIREKIDEIGIITGTKVCLYTFKEWVEYKMKDIPPKKQKEFAKEWLTAVVESFARKRLDIAPIDEPCEGWLTDLRHLIKQT